MLYVKQHQVCHNFCNLAQKGDFATSVPNFEKNMPRTNFTGHWLKPPIEMLSKSYKIIRNETTTKFPLENWMIFPISLCFPDFRFYEDLRHEISGKPRNTLGVLIFAGIYFRDLKEIVFRGYLFPRMNSFNFFRGCLFSRMTTIKDFSRVFIFANRKYVKKFNTSFWLFQVVFLRKLLTLR